MKDRLQKLIKEALTKPPKKGCNCGCDECNKAPILNENLQSRIIMTENMKYHIDGKKPLIENTFRYGSKAFLDLWAEARYLYSRDAIDLSGMDKEIILETHLGEYGLYEGKMVPLDMPMEEKVQMLDGYEVDFFKTKANVYANIEIPSDNSMFEDNIQIKGVGQTEEEALENLKQNYEKYKKGLYEGKMTSLNKPMIKKTTSLPILNESILKNLVSKIIKETVVGADKDFVISIMQKLKSQGKLDSDAERTIISYMNHPSGNREGVLHILKALEGKDLNEAEYQGKKVEIGKPKRGGSKKFYVYVIDPKSKKVKKVSFGAAGGGQNLAVKIRDPKARKAFAARQNCDQKKDKTKPGYWSCNIGRYWKSLGGGSNFSGYW